MSILIFYSEDKITLSNLKKLYFMIFVHDLTQLGKNKFYT